MATTKTTAVATVEGAVSPELDAQLRAEAIVEAINANLPEGIRKLVPIPKGFVLKRANKEMASIAFHAVYELIGGVPRMAHWATENPTQFYTLYAKLLQSGTETPVGATTINIVSAVPSSPLDAVTIDQAGKVVDIDFDEVPE